MNKYKFWDCMEVMPSGWAIDKTVGSPLHGYTFITNRKSVFNGQKRALLQILPSQKQLFNDAGNKQLKDVTFQSSNSNKKSKGTVIDCNVARQFNELARSKFKRMLLNEILVDIKICEIEGWAKTEYLNELKHLINNLGNEVTCIQQ